MKTSSKILLALTLVAVGLFGVAYLDVFAYTRTPSASTIIKDSNTGNPITFTLGSGDFDHGGTYQYAKLVTVCNSVSTFSEFFTLDNTFPYSDTTKTIYNLPICNYSAYWQLYNSSHVLQVGAIAPDPADTFSITGAISINYPENTVNYDTEPDHFVVTYALDSIYASPTYQNKIISIRYGSSPDNLIQHAPDYNFTTTATSSNGFGFFIDKPALLGQTNGYAQATLWYQVTSGVQQALGSSEIIHWTVGSVASASGATQTDFGIFGNAIRDVSIWLFVPASPSFNQFGTLITTVQNKPPLGYFTLIKDDFNALASSSATVTWNLSAISSILSAVKTGLAWLLWLLWAVWLLIRITRWDWHL